MSSQADNLDVDLAGAVAGAGGAPGDAGVEAGAVLRRFAHAVVARSEPELRRAARAVVAELGAPALVEAAGVVAQFEGVNRVADATGIVLDDMLEQVGPSVLGDLDLSSLRTD